MCQMIILTRTFIPDEQFDLDIILKVTADILIWIGHKSFSWTAFFWQIEAERYDHLVLIMPLPNGLEAYMFSPCPYVCP